MNSKLKDIFYKVDEHIVDFSEHNCFDVHHLWFGEIMNFEYYV